MKFLVLMIPNVYRNNQTHSHSKMDAGKFAEMGRFNDEMAKKFKLLDASGLHSLQEGARVSFSKGKGTITDGPFIEAKEVLGGYWTIEAPSKDELVKFMQKCPADDGDIIEVRQFFEEAELQEMLK